VVVGRSQNAAAHERASRAAVLEISYPLFVALFAWVFCRQPIQWPVIVGGIFIFIGSAIIVGWSAHDG